MCGLIRPLGVGDRVTAETHRLSTHGKTGRIIRKHGRGSFLVEYDAGGECWFAGRELRRLYT